ncbi:malate permease and related proteins [Thermostichus sp. MS-CIW-19]
MLTTLFQVYLPLLGWTLLGFVLQRGLPPPWRHWLNPQALGRFMFWVGVPLGTLGFMQTADLSGQLWAAPLVCWLATGLGYTLASAWLQWQHHTWQGKKDWDPWLWSRGRRGSFYLTATLGNTGYLGYPICLAVGGSAYFGWALFYDLLGTLLAAYGLGVWVASRYSASFTPPWQATLRVLSSPTLWSFFVGLAMARHPLPEWLAQGLTAFAWSTIPLSLILLGIRLAQVPHWGSLRPAAAALFIKIVVLPLLVGLGLALTPYPPLAKLVLVLQTGMPPAIATLVLAEEYDLDRELTATALALGYVAALLTLPFWLLLWGT